MTTEVDSFRENGYGGSELGIAMSIVPHTTQIEQIFARLHANEPKARDELLVISQERLLMMTRKMLSNAAWLRRWVDSGDVLQSANVRLKRALEACDLPSPRDFFNLAAFHVRATVIDLIRYHSFKSMWGAKLDSPSIDEDSTLAEAVIETSPIPQLSEWADFHDAVGALPPDLREIVNLHVYFELSLPETAKYLGLNLSMVRRRWAEARLCLGNILENRWPDGFKKNEVS